MKQFVEKLVSLEREISAERGELALFALFLREDTQDKWDLVVAASWVEANKREALRYLAKQLRSHFEPQELLSLSRIVLIDVGNPALKAINQAIRVEHGTTEVRKSNFFGLQIEHAYIITSKREGEMSNSEAT
jgi:hypothetical protein